jgi:hypothetical protein
VPARHRRRHVRGLGRQLADRADGSDVWGTATARAGGIGVTGPDFADIMRTLTVTIDGGRGWHLSVTAGRGAVPGPRPQAAAAILRAGWHLRRLAGVLGELGRCGSSMPLAAA